MKSISLSIVLALTVTGLSGCSGRDIFTPPDGTEVFRDDFETTLKEGWVLAGMPVDLSLTEQPGFLTLFPSSAIPTGEAAATTALLRDIDGDFVIATRIIFETVTDLQSSGLVIQGEDGRTVVLGLSEIEQVGFRGVIMLADRGPNVDRGRAALRSDLTSMYLRLSRTGDRYTGSFSEDGVSYTVVGTLSNDLSDAVRAGVGTVMVEACTANCQAREPAHFDFFEVLAPEE